MATFIDKEGSIFDSGAHMLVCPVNCTPGVMGKGLALAFAKRWPRLSGMHWNACSDGRVCPGGGAAVWPGAPNGHIAVWLFPTKRHWANPSLIEDIRDGLATLTAFRGSVRHSAEKAIIAVPALGCGLGGLRWEDVRPLIVEALAPLDITVMLYAPKEGAA